MEQTAERAEWTKSKTQQLIDLVKVGHTSAEICKLTGWSYGSVSTKATKIGL